MTYTLNVSGHGDFATTDEAKAFEEDVMQKAKQFVASLEGVGTATGTGNHVGTVNLKEDA